MAENKILPSCIALPLEADKLSEIVGKAKDYALMHGICMRSRVNFNPDALQVSKSFKIFADIITFRDFIF